MTSETTVRGRMVGAGPMGEPGRGDAAPCIRVSFWCAKRHETRLRFAADAEIPDTWDCLRCGNPAGQNEHDPPALLRAEPYKTHLAYVKERRSPADGEAILAEALDRLHGVASAPVAAPPARLGGPPRRSPAAGTGSRPRPRRRPADGPGAAAAPPEATLPGPGPAGCRRCRPDGCKGCGYRPANCTCTGGPRSQLSSGAAGQ